MKTYFAYIARCADDTLYVGITTNLLLRVRQHNGLEKGGAKYTRNRRPVAILYYEQFPDRALAMRREYVLKKLTHEQKELLCRGFTLQTVTVSS